MRWIDLLRMSSNSLKRRKLRTFLTVLGVVIGTASIVVMISLGLGLQESMYQEIEQSGGVTSLTVTGKGSSQMGGFYMGDTSNEEEATKYTTDDVIEQIKKLDHVADVQPVLSIDALLKKNGYAIGNVDATIIAQKPKMASHILKMRENMAEAMGISVDCLNVKATTEEGLGFTGREEGIAAQAICLLI